MRLLRPSRSLRKNTRRRVVSVGSFPLQTTEMLEDVIANYISDFSDKYLYGFDSKQLSITWTKGDIQASNLLLKADALRELHPAIEVASGRIGNLKIKINYLRLKTDPVVISLEDVLILLVPKKDISMTEQQVKELMHDKLLNRL